MQTAGHIIKTRVQFATVILSLFNENSGSTCQEFYFYNAWITTTQPGMHMFNIPLSLELFSDMNLKKNR